MAIPVDLGSFDIYRGDAWEGIQLLPELDANGNVVELSTYGDTWTAQIRYAADAANPISLTVDQSNYDGSVDSSPTAVRISFTLDAATTAAMANDGYAFDIQVTGGSLSPYTYARGRLRVSKDITHA